MKLKPKQWFGVFIIVVGAILLFFSHYIAEQVAIGRGQIARGQQQVNTVNSLFSSSQYTKPLGGLFTRSGQEKINAGIREADEYEVLSNQLKIAGVILIVVGFGIVIYFRKK